MVTANVKIRRRARRPRQRPSPRPRQGELPFAKRPSGPGGKRPGAGRKPNGDKALVSHLRRPELEGRHPLHVTLSIVREVGRLRIRERFLAVRTALRAGAEKFGLRIVHYSVQNYHLHLVLEATDRAALSRGVQGLAVRIARSINRHLGRQGKVFADRFHARVLSSPRQTRNALRYVLSNHLRHASGSADRPCGTDPFSSGPYFDGWTTPWRIAAAWDPGGSVGVEPRTWLLRVGWRRAGGPIVPWAVPGPMS